MYVLSWAFWNGKAWTESIMASDSSLEKPRVRGFGSKEIQRHVTRASSNLGQSRAEGWRSDIFGATSRRWQ